MSHLYCLEIQEFIPTAKLGEELHGLPPHPGKWATRLLLVDDLRRNSDCQTP